MGRTVSTLIHSHGDTCRCVCLSVCLSGCVWCGCESSLCSSVPACLKRVCEGVSCMTCAVCLSVCLYLCECAGWCVHALLFGSSEWVSAYVACVAYVADSICGRDIHTYRQTDRRPSIRTIMNDITCVVCRVVSCRVLSCQVHCLFTDSWLHYDGNAGRRLPAHPLARKMSVCVCAYSHTHIHTSASRGCARTRLALFGQPSSAVDRGTCLMYTDGTILNALVGWMDGWTGWVQPPYTSLSCRCSFSWGPSGVRACVRAVGSLLFVLGCACVS